MEMIESFVLRSGLKELRSRPELISDYVDHSLKRMNALENKIHAFVPEKSRKKRLERRINDLQESYSAGENLPPLYGLPAGVKDIFHVDGLPTGAGTRLAPKILTGEEGYTVKKLREAGAVILGKTVTTELAYFVPGPTRNPHNTDHTPGGSSSGSAAAVAAGYCPLAVGTQTIGSVIRPAAFCGVVGFKPSYDRVPREGMVDFSPSADHVGFFTQNVEDMQTAASHLVPDWGGPAAEDEADKGGANDGKKIAVLGIPADSYLQQAGGKALSNMRKNTDKLRHAGFKVKKLEIMQNIEKINKAHQLLISREFADVHDSIYEQHGDRLRPETVELIEEGRQVTDRQYSEALKSQKNLRSTLQEEMSTEDIDIWVSPAAPGPAPEGIDSTGDPVMNLPWTHAGLPAVTVPSGRTEEGMPLGLQLAAAYGNDEELLDMADSIVRVLRR